jgi:hypothetical protein
VPAAYLKFDALEQSVTNQKLTSWLRRIRPRMPGPAPQKAG